MGQLPRFGSRGNAIYVHTTQALARCPLFKGFTDTGLQILASIAIPRQFPADSPIFVENMLGDALYVIEQGAVSIRMRDRAGMDKELAVLEAGESFGELALMIQASRMVSAVAATEVRVLEMRKHDFAQLQRQKPQACLKLLLSISDVFARDLQANRDALKTGLL